MCARLCRRRFKDMSLHISKLQNVRIRGKKTTARCPACAESGGDNKGEHLIINSQGHFGCVVYPGHGPDAEKHRQRIFVLCGDRETKPLVMRRTQETVASGRSGHRFQSHSEDTPIKTGLLGRLGRVFEIHAQRHREIEASGFPLLQQNDIRSGVPAVLESEVRPNQPLTYREILLLRRAGAENDPVIITALNPFNARIVGIKAASFKRCKPCRAEFHGWPESKFCSPQCWQKSLLEPLDEKARLKSCLNYLRDFEARLERMREEREQTNAEL
jgi:hypothetical protein